MSKVLIKCKDNWADEMDLEGFSIMDSDAWTKRKESISNITESFTICVGTNEDIEYRNGNAFLRRLVVKEITDDEANVIIKYLGDSFGHCPIDNLCEEEDEDCGFFIDSIGRQVYWYYGMKLDIVDGKHKGKFAIVIGRGDDSEDLTIASPTMSIFVYDTPTQLVGENVNEHNPHGEYVIIDSKLIREKEYNTSSCSSTERRDESFNEYENRVAEMLKNEN